MTTNGDNKEHPWTTGEVAILRRNGHLGAAALAAMLGRSQASVTSAARRFRISLRRQGSRRGSVLGQPRGVSLRSEVRVSLASDRLLAALVVKRMQVDRDADLCPFCGRRPIVNHSTGLCAVCHVRKLTEAHRDALAELEARRELDAAKQMLHRAREAAGETPRGGVRDDDH
ncbi:MAG: hypothetical protein ACLQUT_00570 [Thermoleophilia bacterium]